MMNWDTVLTSFARKGDLSMVQRALDKGADPNAKIFHGETALIIAAKSIKDDRKAIEIFAALIEAGADIHHKNDRGETALSLSKAYGQDRPRVTWLIEAGADIHINPQEFKKERAARALREKKDAISQKQTAFRRYLKPGR